MSSHDEGKVVGKIEFYGGYEVYDENGIDLTLLRENLKRTIENRLANNARGARIGERYAGGRPALAELFAG